MRTLASLVWMVASLPALCGATSGRQATKIYHQGRRAERAGEMSRAYLLYSQAAALQPANQWYRLRSEAVRGRAALESKPQPSPSTAARPDAGWDRATVSPASVFDTLTERDRAAQRKPLPPPELKGAAGRKDFALRADAKSLFQQVARAFGLDTVFDGDYQEGRPISFQLEQADYREALHALEAATGSFIVPLADRLFLVVKDTEQKRKEAEPAMAATIPVPQALTLPELVELAQGVRQLFALEHIAWDSQKNTVVLRDRVSRVLPARRVLEQLLHHRPQVEVELELLEVDRSSTLTYGLDPQTSFPLVYLGGFWNSKLSLLSSIQALGVFGGGQTLFGVALADAKLFASMSRSMARSLLRSEVRALDGMPATFHVGDQFPILNSGYFGPASFGGKGAYTPPPSFTFEDLGILMKITPHIHGMEEVTLEIDAEFKVLSGQSLNGIPVISNRKLTSNVRLREGQWGVVAGLMTSSEARSIHGIAGLAGLPLLGPLVRQNNKNQDSTEVLLVIKPTLLNLPADQNVTPAMRVGSETRPVTPL